jgi:hypothetical protein
MGFLAISAMRSARHGAQHRSPTSAKNAGEGQASFFPSAQRHQLNKNFISEQRLHACKLCSPEAGLRSTARAGGSAVPKFVTLVDIKTDTCRHIDRHKRCARERVSHSDCKFIDMMKDERRDENLQCCVMADDLLGFSVTGSSDRGMRGRSDV